MHHIFTSRRSFLKFFLAGTGGAVAAYLGFFGPVRALYHWLSSPTLGDAPVGTLDASVLQTVLAATEALVENPIGKDHYVDFFQWRSAHLRGYKALYERFTTTVSRSARQSTGCDFATCDLATRLRILEKSFQVRGARRLYRLRAGVLDRDWVLFDKYIVEEILAFFGRTDAWVLAGYEAWPGTPRGLERYRRAPRNTG